MENECRIKRDAEMKKTWEEDKSKGKWVYNCKKSEKDKDVKVQDDIVTYLTMFKRLMVAYEIQKECWASKLASNLIGKAQTAYASMNVADASSYD